MNPSHPSSTGLQPTVVSTQQSTPVYNLTVLVRQLESGETIARAANLATGEVQASSIRGALSKIVAAAKVLISERVALGESIPWIDPPLAADESESRFLVPLHL